MKNNRIGLSFHESFTLNVPAVSKILNLSLANEGRIDSTIIENQTSLGPNYVKSMPKYARATGLMEMGSFKLTPLGEVVCVHDPNLTNPTTLWAMHYHLSAPNGPGPVFWANLITNYLVFGKEVSRFEVAQEISRSRMSQDNKPAIKERTAQSTATVFLGTYTKSDALGQLGLIRAISERNGYSRISESQSPPSSIVAFALADHWERCYGEQQTVSLNELARDDGFARVMWINYQQFDEILMDLKRKNIVDLYRIAQPYQVARLWSNKTELLNALYL